MFLDSYLLGIEISVKIPTRIRFVGGHVEAIPSGRSYKGCADVTVEFLKVNRYREQDSVPIHTVFFYYIYYIYIYYIYIYLLYIIYNKLNCFACILNLLFLQGCIDYAQGVMKTTLPNL